jgi:iron(III) transport system substrate-binding protein
MTDALRASKALARRSAAALVVALAAASLVACGDEDDGGDGDSGEPGITLYSGRVPPQIGPVIDLYEERTGTDIEVRFGETSQLASTIIEEGDNSPADAFFAQDAGALGAVQDEGLFTELPPAILERVKPGFRSRAGEWVGVTARARVIGYGPQADRSELPASVLDLTEPEWSGRVGWAPSNASFQAFVTALRLTEGEDAAREWLEGMLANDTAPYENNIALRDAIAAGEVDVGLLNHYYVAQAKAEDPDYPVDIYSPPGDIGAMVNTAGIGVLESTDQRDAALDFVRFLLSREAQEFFAESSREYPVTEGVPAHPSLTPLAEIPRPDVDLSQIDDLQGTIELLQETGAL